MVESPDVTAHIKCRILQNKYMFCIKLMNYNFYRFYIFNICFCIIIHHVLYLFLMIHNYYYRYWSNSFMSFNFYVIIYYPDTINKIIIFGLSPIFSFLKN